MRVLINFNKLVNVNTRTDERTDGGTDAQTDAHIMTFGPSNDVLRRKANSSGFERRI